MSLYVLLMCLSYSFLTFEVYSLMFSHDLLCTWYYTCVCLFLPFFCNFFPVLFPMVSNWVVVLVIPLLFFKSHILIFFIFGVTDKTWLLIGWKIYIGFFAWFTGWILYGYAPTIVTLRGSALVNGFDCGVLFIWFPSWFITWSFFWPTSLTGTLGGTAGGFAFLNISARVSDASLCLGH